MWYRLASRVLTSPEYTMHVTDKSYDIPQWDLVGNELAQTHGLGSNTFGNGFYTSSNPSVVQGYLKGFQGQGRKPILRKQKLPVGMSILQRDNLSKEDVINIINAYREILASVDSDNDVDKHAEHIVRQFFRHYQPPYTLMQISAHLGHHTSDPILTKTILNAGYDAMSYPPFGNILPPRKWNDTEEEYKARVERLTKQGDNVLVFNSLALSHPKLFTKSKLRPDTLTEEEKQTIEREKSALINKDDDSEFVRRMRFNTTEDASVTYLADLIGSRQIDKAIQYAAHAVGAFDEYSLLKLTNILYEEGVSRSEVPDQVVDIMSPSGHTLFDWVKVLANDKKVNLSRLEKYLQIWNPEKKPSPYVPYAFQTSNLDAIKLLVEYGIDPHQFADNIGHKNPKKFIDFVKDFKLNPNLAFRSLVEYNSYSDDETIAAADELLKLGGNVNIALKAAMNVNNPALCEHLLNLGGVANNEAISFGTIMKHPELTLKLYDRGGKISHAIKQIIKVDAYAPIIVDFAQKDPQEFQKLLLEESIGLEQIAPSILPFILSNGFKVMGNYWISGNEMLSFFNSNTPEAISYLIKTIGGKEAMKRLRNQDKLQYAPMYVLDLMIQQGADAEYIMRNLADMSRVYGNQDYGYGNGATERAQEFFNKYQGLFADDSDLVAAFGGVADSQV